jgi:hypothetical protein
MDDRCLLDQVVRGLERRVALADDQHPLIGEAARVDRHVPVPFGGLDPGNRRHVHRAEAGRDDHRSGPDRLTVLAGHRESIGALADPADPAAVPDVEAAAEVGQVADVVVGVREVRAGVVREPQRRVIAEQRVPVDTKVLLGVVPAGVRLVDGDHATVAGERAVERAGRGPGFDDQVLTSRPLEEVPQLQARGTGADHDVVHASYTRSPGPRDSGESRDVLGSV